MAWPGSQIRSWKPSVILPNFRHLRETFNLGKSLLSLFFIDNADNRQKTVGKLDVLYYSLEVPFFHQ